MLAEEKHGPGDWEISDLLAQWWRPNFESFMVRCCGGRKGSAEHPRLTFCSLIVPLRPCVSLS